MFNLTKWKMYLRRCIKFPFPSITNNDVIWIDQHHEVSTTVKNEWCYYWSHPILRQHIRSTSHHPFLKLSACLKFNFETPLSTQMPTRHVSFPNPSITHIFTFLTLTSFNRFQKLLRLYDSIYLSIARMFVLNTFICQICCLRILKDLVITIIILHSVSYKMSTCAALNLSSWRICTKQKV